MSSYLGYAPINSLYAVRYPVSHSKFRHVSLLIQELHFSNLKDLVWFRARYCLNVFHLDIILSGFTCVVLTLTSVSRFLTGFSAPLDYA